MEMFDRNYVLKAGYFAATDRILLFSGNVSCDGNQKSRWDFLLFKDFSGAEYL